jgi:hypothetical protein
MKSKELIRLLQVLDPTGETEVFVGSTPIYFLEKLPAYYDGYPQMLVQDETEGSHYNIIGAKYLGSGDKIRIHIMSIDDILFDDYEAPVDYSELPAQTAAYYKENDEIDRKKSKDLEFQVEMAAFFKWAENSIREMNGVYSGGDLREITDKFYLENLSPKDPLKDLPPRYDEKTKHYWGHSYDERRAAHWSDSLEVVWGGNYWKIQKR